MTPDSNTAQVNQKQTAVVLKLYLHENDFTLFAYLGILCSNGLSCFTLDIGTVKVSLNSQQAINT